MAPPAAIPRPIVSVANPNRDGVIGLCSAVAFLTFVFKFSERVQKSKARQERARSVAEGDGAAAGFAPRKDWGTLQAHKARSASGLYLMTSSIVSKSCGAREALTALKLSLMLLLRTAGSVWVADHWGRIVKALTARNWPGMHALVVQFAGVTVLLSLLNGLLKYYTASLKIEVRHKITSWCHDQYLRPLHMILYKVNKVGDQKIENLDHMIASDLERFSDHFVEVVSQSLKPTADFFVYAFELSRRQGLATPLTLYGWFAGTSCLMTLMLPPVGRLAAKGQQLEGKFRSKHAELIANCEQVAFLGGERPERDTLNSELDTLVKHYRYVQDTALTAEVVHQYFNKYSSTVIGLFLISRPLRLGLGNSGSLETDQIAQYFTSTWRNMEAFSSAILEILNLTNRVGRLAGFSNRVSKLMAGLEERPSVLAEEIAAASKGQHPPTYRDGDHLEFDSVSVYKPDGALLVKDLTFKVERGQRILVTGGNGCGKSSLFRVIRRLWPLVEGTITTPAAKDIHFLTQVNFVPSGKLRDLVIYPHSLREMKANGRSDKHVHTCLRWAHVSPKVVKDRRAELEFAGDHGIIVRPELDDVRDWQKDLSPGQKQRLAFARLFYHRPSFVVLDECTNGVSPDVEHDLYDRCSQLNLGVFSISHKHELKLFHDYELHFNGDARGTWAMSSCSETRDKVTRASALVKLPTGEKGGKTESRITYERHVWFAN